MSETATRKRFPNSKQKEEVKVASPGRVQQARLNKEGDYKSAYGGKPPRKHKPTDGRG